MRESAQSLGSRDWGLEFRVGMYLMDYTEVHSYRPSRSFRDRMFGFR